MSATSTPPVIDVTGGVAGVRATYAAVRSLAGRFDAAGDRMRARAGDDARVLLDPDLLESAPLSPRTFAEAEASVLAASAGAHGALALSLTYEANAVLVRATVTAFEECDRIVATAFDVLDHAVGFELGHSAPALALVGLTAAASWRRLPARTRRRLEGELEEWADEHPEMVQHGVASTGGLLDGLAAAAPLGLLGLGGFHPTAAAAPLGLLGLGGFHPTAADAAGDLAGLYPPEGAAVVRPRTDLATPLGRAAPADVADLMRHLAETNELSPPGRDDDQGTIEIQTLHGLDGSARHIVYLPGTDELTTTPWSFDGDARDLPADLRVISGADTTYADGIRQAMTQAGIGPHDPVLLVGHSLGGMEAASLLAHGSGFDVTHVVTAGSPIAGIHDFPVGSHVLSLENRGDLVPLLDGRDNADSVSQVTVRFDDHETSIAGNHDLRHYVAGATAVDTSTDPSIREQLDSLRSTGFLDSSSTAISQVFQVTR